MEEIIKPLQEFEHLNDCKLPLIDRIQKIDYYFENDIKDLNKSVLLLEKAIINNNESIKNIFKKEEEKKRIFKIKKNILIKYYYIYFALKDGLTQGNLSEEYS